MKFLGEDPTPNEMEISESEAESGPDELPVDMDPAADHRLAGARFTLEARSKALRATAVKAAWRAAMGALSRGFARYQKVRLEAFRSNQGFWY